MNREKKEKEDAQKKEAQKKETKKDDEKDDSSDEDSDDDDWAGEDEKNKEKPKDEGSPNPPAPSDGGNSSSGDDGEGDYFGGPNLKAIRVSKTAKASVYTRYGILLASIGGGEVSSDDQSGWGGTHPNADEGDSGGVRPGAIGKKKAGERGGGKKKNAKDLLGGDTATDGWTGVHPKVYGVFEASVRSSGSGQAPRSAGVTRSAVPNANDNRALQEMGPGQTSRQSAPRDVEQASMMRGGNNRALQGMEPGVSLVQGAVDIGQRLRGNRTSSRLGLASEREPSRGDARLGLGHVDGEGTRGLPGPSARQRSGSGSGSGSGSVSSLQGEPSAKPG